MTFDEKLENETTLQQYEGQPNDVPELPRELIDKKGISSMASFRTPDNDTVNIDLAKISKHSDDQSNRLLSPSSNQSDTRINAFSESSAISNTDPNNAIFLPPSYYGYELYDLAGSTDRWYCFSTTGTSKISLMFQQEANGDYDLLLYELNGSTLYLVDYSMESGTVESISYIAATGTYYLRVTPYIPTTVPYNYMFMLNVISNGNFDSDEPNDTPSDATVFANTVNISANIDNPYDEDWYRLSVSTAKTKDITVSNAPTGNHYAVLLYDSNFNTLRGYYVDGSATQQVDFGVGEYYICIFSVTGYYTTDNYNLKATDYVPTVQPYDSLNIPGMRLEEGQLYTLDVLYFQGGGPVVFDLNCKGASGSKLVVIVDLRFDGVKYASPNDWERDGDFYVMPGSKQYTVNIPYIPSYPTGKMRIMLVADGGTIEVSGTVKAMPR